MSTMATTSDVDSGAEIEMGWDLDELNKLARANNEELVETLFQQLQRRLPPNLFDKMTGNLLEERVELENELANVYDKLSMKMQELLKKRLLESLQKWSSAKEKKMTQDSASTPDKLQLTEFAGGHDHSDLNPPTSCDTQNCRANTKTVKKRKIGWESTTNVKMRLPEPVNEPGIHALMIDHVLDTIFENFVFEDNGATNLAKFRLVCRIWNKRATEALRKSEFEITFGEGNLDQDRSDSRLQQFMQTMEGSSIIPYRCYSFKRDILSSLNVKLFENFLQTIGPDALTLKFYFGLHIYPPLTEVYRMNLNLISLEKLEIHFTNWSTGSFGSTIFEIDLSMGHGRLISNQSGIPQFIIKFLGSAPKLKVFGLRENLGSRICPPEILKWLPKTVKDVRLGLQELSAPYFTALSESELKLVKFSVRSWSVEPQPVDGKKEVNDFFYTQNQSLTTLKLNGCSMRIFSKTFPRVESLRSLILEFDTVFPLDMSINDVFPNLRVLKLHKLLCNLINTVLVKPGEIVSSVEELHLSTEICQQEAMDVFAEKFPNVKKLFMCLYDATNLNTLSSVCTFYTEIEELHVSLSEIDFDFDVNAILCGVSMDIYKLLLHNNNFRQIDLEGVRKRSCLLNLTKLKKLVVTSSPSRCAPLTDVSAHYILLKMESLKDLVIPDSRDFQKASLQISSYYMDQLTAKLKIFYGRLKTKNGDDSNDGSETPSINFDSDQSNTDFARSDSDRSSDDMMEVEEEDSDSD